MFTASSFVVSAMICISNPDGGSGTNHRPPNTERKQVMRQFDSTLTDGELRDIAYFATNSVP